MGTHPIFESDFDCLTDMSKCVKLVQTKSSKKRKRLGCEEYTKECFDCVADSLTSITTLDHRLRSTYNRYWCFESMISHQIAGFIFAQNGQDEDNYKAKFLERLQAEKNWTCISKQSFESEKTMADKHADELLHLHHNPIRQIKQLSRSRLIEILSRLEYVYVPNEDSDNETMKSYPTVFSFERADSNIVGTTFALFSNTRLTRETKKFIDSYKSIYGYRNKKFDKKKILNIVCKSNDKKISLKSFCKYSGKNSYIDAVTKDEDGVERKKYRFAKQWSLVKILKTISKLHNMKEAVDRCFDRIITASFLINLAQYASITTNEEVGDRCNVDKIKRAQQIARSTLLSSENTSILSGTHSSFSSKKSTNNKYFKM